MTYAIGIDVGSGAVKSVLFDVQGNRLTDRGIAALQEFDIKLHARYQEGGYGGDGDDGGGFGFGGMGTDIEVVDL